LSPDKDSKYRRNLRLIISSSIPSTMVIVASTYWRWIRFHNTLKMRPEFLAFSKICARASTAELKSREK
jgi:hypothetical protein